MYCPIFPNVGVSIGLIITIIISDMFLIGNSKNTWRFFLDFIWKGWGGLLSLCHPAFLKMGFFSTRHTLILYRRWGVVFFPTHSPTQAKQIEAQQTKNKHKPNKKQVKKQVFFLFAMSHNSSFATQKQHVLIL